MDKDFHNAVLSFERMGGMTCPGIQDALCVNEHHLSSCNCGEPAPQELFGHLYSLNAPLREDTFAVWDWFGA